MLTLQSFLVYALAGLSATTAHALPREDRGASPKSNSVVPKPSSVAPELDPGVVPSQDCVVPEIAILGLVADFTLSAFASGFFETYPLSLPAKHSKYGDQPFITTPAAKSKATFRLTDGKLTTGGPNHDKYTAYFGPVPPEYPPYYAPLLFGDEDQGTRFTAAYTCGPSEGVVLALTSPRTYTDFFMIPL